MYEILTQSVGGIGKMFYQGETVPKNSFVLESIEELIRRGYIKEVATEEIPKAEIKQIDDVSKVKLISDLTEREIPFSPTASKKELYALWIK